MKATETTQRLFVEHPLEDGAAVACTPAQAHYLANVLRLGPGARLLVFNGRDGEWAAEIAEAARARCTLRVTGRTRAQEAGPDIHYLFAPLKRARLDYMVQKATEMGVAALRPVITRRTVAGRVKIERMRANAIEAAEQCGVLRVPEVFAPEPLDQVLQDWDTARPIVYCDEEAPIASPLAALAGLTAGQGGAAGAIAVLIGPEGGFTPEEQALLRAQPHVVPISLGPRVMRADTAAVAALALVNAILGDWSS